MSNTKIEWATKVWNPITGCTKVSAGCKNCYAETYAKRFWGTRKFTDVQYYENKLEIPLHWKKPQRIFVNSMSDLFHPEVPFEFIYRVYHQMMVIPQHIYIILTKRPERAIEFFHWWFKLHNKPTGIRLFWDYKNIWLGVSVEDQKTADERIPWLLQTPAAVRFVSAEPLLEKIDLQKYLLVTNDDCPIKTSKIKSINKLDWVICGGESGKNARPIHPDWARSLRDQCKEAGVPFFFKQWGEWHPNITGKIINNTTGDIQYFNDKGDMVHIGKKNAGRLLDGIEHNEFPKIK